MITEEAVAFLRETPPFTFLDEPALRDIARNAAMEFHPKGSTIMRQGGPAPGCLSVIKQGSARVYLKTGEGDEIAIGIIGPGDSFGLLSLLSGDVARESIVALEDTVLYLLMKEDLLGLIETNAAFSAHYLKSFLKRNLAMLYKEIQDRSLMYGGGDKMLFTVTLDDIVSGGMITAPMDAPVREAAGLMSRHKISSLVLLDADGFPAGILTDRDLRDKVVAKGRNTAGPASSIMSVTLIKSESGDYCFEALLKMVRYNIHHLLVVNRGEIRGMITSHDFMMLQGNSPLSVAREIEGQGTIDGLIPVSKKINRIITVLVKERARASNITRIITEVNDRLLRKVLEITEKKFGPPPVPYCWIVFGSEGRKEQTFRTDQDNAIIYDDPRDDEEAVGAYFHSFALSMRESLAKCGFPPCRADYMASNPRWRRPLKVWKSYFAEWINTPTPEAILFTLIFFDFRPVYGDFTLAERLRAYLGTVLKNQNRFLMSMADEILRNKPPLGFWGAFKVEKSGEHKNAINIKMNGLAPIVDAARHSALHKGVYNTSTIERLRELKDKRSMISEFCDELEQAFEFLMSLRIRRQFDRMEAGAEPDNFINPGALGHLERKMLGESFKIIARTQESIKAHYGARV